MSCYCLTTICYSWDQDQISKICTIMDVVCYFLTIKNVNQETPLQFMSASYLTLCLKTSLNSIILSQQNGLILTNWCHITYSQVACMLKDVNVNLFISVSSMTEYPNLLYNFIFNLARYSTLNKCYTYIVQP